MKVVLLLPTVLPALEQGLYQQAIPRINTGTINSIYDYDIYTTYLSLLVKKAILSL
jgi:hypothetical protein